MEDGFKQMDEAISDFGISLYQACDTVSKFAACIPPIDETDILLVKRNPNLSWLDKYFIIKKMKKQMKYDEAKKNESS